VATEQHKLDKQTRKGFLRKQASIVLHNIYEVCRISDKPVTKAALFKILWNRITYLGRFHITPPRPVPFRSTERFVVHYGLHFESQIEHIHGIDVSV
jgi:hypothetical protein